MTTYHPCSAEASRKSGALIYPEPLAGDLYFTLIRLRARTSGIQFQVGTRDLTFLYKLTDRLFCPPSHLLSRHLGSFPGIKMDGREVNHYTPPKSDDVKNE